MKSIKYPTLFLLFYMFSLGLVAQEQQQTESIDEGSISDQFDFVIRKSSNWNDQKGQPYEVIKRNMVFTLKDHVIDSLNTYKSALNDANRTVRNHEGKIQQLTTELGQVKNNLSTTQKDKDSMSLLGMPMSKSNYRLITWTIIGALLIVLSIFIFNERRSRLIIVQTNNKLAEVENEFSEHRRISLEREQKIKRQLQDEINRHNG